MGHSVCPWWIGWALASPLRKLWQDPARILAPHVREGMTVLEPGPGMGFFTLELARRVGPGGKVVAVDLQPEMLDGLRRRAARAGLAGRIEPRLASAEALGVNDLTGRIDLVLAFAMVHELPDQARFFAEVASLLAPGGRILLAEPSGHVPAAAFEATLAIAAAAGLRRHGDAPVIARSRAALLVAAGG
jgi:ubiquinone/menaquinone biosynthesis C-methylase UbiE